MPHRHILRIVTALLLVLIAFDLAAVHTCAFDSHGAPGAATASVAPLDSPDGSGHSPAVAHPDHCFCHGISIGEDPSMLAEPSRKAGAVPDTPSGHLHRVASRLYHPPQLPA